MYCLLENSDITRTKRYDFFTISSFNPNNFASFKLNIPNLNTSNISKYYENTFNTYGITHVILYKNSKLNIFLSRSDRYKELYSDKKFVIYERD